MTEIELLEHVLANLKAGKPAGDGLMYDGKCIGGKIVLLDFHSPYLYTLVPRTHIVNTFEVPAPESEELKFDQIYYYPSHGSTDRYFPCGWTNHTFDYNRLKNGQVFLTPKAAILNQKAQAKVDPYEGDL